MKTSCYPEILLTHLGKYRRTHLKIEHPGDFPYRGKILKKDHILPPDRIDLNLLPLINKNAEAIRCSDGLPMKWHRYAHHLNSSQMLAVNLFQPLLESPEGRQILGLVTDTKYPSVGPTGFEYIPDPEENTNIDFCVSGADRNQLFIEVKLTEADFGRAPDDEEHRSKFNKIYANRCRGRIRLESDNRWTLFRHNYQFYRNALFADAKTRIWFLIPGIHQSLIKRAERCMNDLDASIRPYVEIVKLERLFDEIQQRTKKHPKLAAHYAEFRQKYQPALS